MSNPDLVIAVGAFGAAVARLFADQNVPVVPASPKGVDLAFLPTARTMLLVSSVPAPQVEIPLSEAAHRWRTRFLPIVLETHRLRVGPVSRAGVRGCSACYRGRLRQHSPELPVLDALDQHVRQHEDALKRGFLGHWPDIAAGIARLALAGLGTTEEDRKVRHFDLLSCIPLETRVVPVHRCRICSGPPEGPPLMRSVARLQDIAKDLVDQGMGGR